MSDDGTPLDATFELNTMPMFEIVFRHKAGGRHSDRAVNTDYHEALEALLTRLASIHTSILSISVQSAPAMELSPDERELDLTFPIRLTPALDLHALRIDITRAQKSIARRANVKPGGGNDQKTICITVSPSDPLMEYDELKAKLIGAPTTPRRRARASLPTVKDLQTSGHLPVGSVLECTVRGKTWKVTMLEDGRVLPEGTTVPRRLGLLTNEVAGHSQSAMRLWSVRREDALISLGALRDELAARPSWTDR